MIFTVSDARDFVSEFVDGGGVCKTSSRVLDAINEAQMILLTMGDWSNTLWRMQFHVSNHCVTCPREVLSLRSVNFECYPGRVWSQCYEFLDGGYGSEDTGGTYDKYLQDIGSHWPTHYPVDQTNPGKLIALSTSAADVDKTIHVRGLTTNKELVHVNGTVGEELRIGRWVNGTEGNMPDLNARTPYLSRNTFYSVTHVIKPQTTGYVCLFCVTDGAYNTWNLAKYHPLEKQPGYRKYRIINHDCTNGDCLIALAKLNYVPMYSDDDVLLIQNLPALKAMIQSIAHGNANDQQSDAGSMQKSTFLLDKQKENESTLETEIQMETDSYFGGDVDSML